MNDGLRDMASFASLTNWGKGWRDVARRGRGKRKRKSKGGGRAGDERRRKTLQKAARGYNLQHLLAVIDQRERREGNGVWSNTG